jgi:hypothetical protein
MDAFDSAANHQTLAEQRKALRAFHRRCVAEGHRNLRQAAAIHLPMALFADFALAIGIAKEISAKLKSNAEIERLRRIGMAELLAAGTEGVEDERVEMDVIFDAIPTADDVREIVSLGLKRVRKDASSRRFSGLGSQVRAADLVQRLGGQLTVVTTTTDASHRGSESQAARNNTGDEATAMPDAGTTDARSTQQDVTALDPSPEAALANDTSRQNMPSERPPFPRPAPRPVPRPAIAPRLPVPARPETLSTTAASTLKTNANEDPPAGANR